MLRASKKANLLGVWPRLILVVLCLLLILPKNAGAASLSIPEINSKYYSAIFLRDCYAQSKFKDAGTTISKTDAADFSKVLAGPTSTTGAGMGRYFAGSNNEGFAMCNDANIVKRSLAALGYNDGVELLKAIGFTNGKQVQTDGSSCDQANYETCVAKYEVDAYISPGNDNDKLNAAISDKGGIQTGAARYAVYYDVLTSADMCKLSTTATAGDKTSVTIVIADKNTAGKYTTQDVTAYFPIETSTYAGSAVTTKTADNSLKTYIFARDPNVNGTCSSLVSEMNKLASSVVTYDEIAGNTPYVSGDDSTKDNKGSTTAKDSGPTCTGGALGWLLCPVASLMNDINTSMANVIDDMLVTKDITDPVSSKAIKSVWQTLVGIANAFLVLAFLVVIFSQATSFGLDAYGIKKTLPRIVAAAILINLSFFLCGIMIDITNVVGGSVKGIVQAGMNSINYQSGAVTFSDYGNIILNIVGVIMAGAGVIGVTAGIVFATGSIAFIFPVLLAGTAGVLFTFMAIALREVMIMLLIIVSPLAFAAMILPNTAPLFKRWYQSFIRLLLIYPVAAAIMYGCALIAKIILAGGNV